MSASAQPRPVLSLLDSTCLIVGIIIGAGIYQMAPEIARGAGGPWGLMGLWLLGGLLSLCGALCYAELATAYPREGGDYVYLSRAYGSWAGFLFGWAQLTVIRPGDIAVMAFAFALYAREVFGAWTAAWGWSAEATLKLFASVAVGALTLINVLGVQAGKWTQNLLTMAKALGLLAMAAAAVAAGPAGSSSEGASGDPIPWTLALIFVLFTYGGWNEMAYVAAEVKDARRNIVRAMVLGMAGHGAVPSGECGVFVCAGVCGPGRFASRGGGSGAGGVARAGGSAGQSADLRLGVGRGEWPDADGGANFLCIGV